MTKVLTRALFEAELDEIAKLMRTCVLPLDDSLIYKHLCFHETIMVHGDDVYRGKARHYRRYKDDGGWYIRMAKRGQIKRYLGSCDLTFINGNDALYQYRFRKEG